MLKAIFRRKKEISKRFEDSLEVEKNIINGNRYEIELPENEKHFDMTPVNYISTEHGTFFWTIENLTEPDSDLIQPLYCCTSNQLALSQF